jgi:hypothetical protein
VTRKEGEEVEGAILLWRNDDVVAVERGEYSGLLRRNNSLVGGFIDT